MSYFDLSKRQTSSKRLSAAVLRYDAERYQAPTMVAQGKGEKAKKILEKAKEHQIPIQEDQLLLDSLMTLDLGEQIPPQLYKVVAEVLVMVRKVNEK